MKLNNLISKKFLTYVFFKVLSIFLITTSIFSIFFIEVKNLFLGISLFVIGFIALILANLIKKPKLAKCLDRSNIFISLIVNISLHVSIGLLALSIIYGFNNFMYSASILLFGIFSYFFCCKRNKILD